MRSAKQPVDQRTVRPAKLLIALMALIIAVQFTQLFLESWKSIIPSLPWNIGDKTRHGFEIKTTTLDSRGDPWFIVERSFRDNSYELRHLANGRVESWTLPVLTHDEINSAVAAQDKDNHPWLVAGKRLAHWDGSQWDFSPTPLDAEIDDYMGPTVIVRDSIVWGIDYAGNSIRLIRLDLAQEPVQAREVSLPEGLDGQDYKFESIVSMGANDLLAVITNEKEVGFYQLNNSEWRKVTSFLKADRSNLYIADLTVDPHGRIWLLLEYWISAKHIGSYDLEEDRWTWYDVEEPAQLANLFLEYHHIAVDGLDRIWLSGAQYRLTEDQSAYEANTYVMGVYRAGPEAKLINLRHYTVLNSKLETSPLARNILGPDGKIWTWDRHLVWMDSRQPELPQPMPDWFVALTGYRLLISLVLIVIGLIALGLIVQLVLRRPKRTSSG